MLRQRVRLSESQPPPPYISQRRKGLGARLRLGPWYFSFFSFFFTLLMFIQIKLHVQNRNNDDDGRHQCQHPNDERGLETWCLRLELAGRGRWGRCSWGEQDETGGNVAVYVSWLRAFDVLCWMSLHFLFILFRYLKEKGFYSIRSQWRVLFHLPLFFRPLWSPSVPV